MPGRSPESITRWLDENLHRLDGPAQMLGTEPNAARRPWDSASVRMLLAASWDYSQAAGNMALPAVYDAVHKASPDYLADRWYLPATPRDMEALERGQVPVFGIESRHQLADFDIVGTSISYTVLFMNFAKHLMMSGIPLRWKDRQARAGDWPMVMVGGQAACAPEFMAAVVDCVWLGEAEDEPGNPGLTGVLARVAGFRGDGTWTARREECYEQLALEFPFLYFPRHVEFSYSYEDRGLPDLTKMVSGYQATLAGLQLPRQRRYVHDLSKADLMTSAPLLFGDPAMGSGDVEHGRGCPDWCVFCRIGWETKPYRQESLARTVQRARARRLDMGSTEISLVAPDPPVHTQKKALIAALLENVTDHVDGSSMRIDDYLSDGDSFALLLNVAGVSSITLGLEGNSQRMRDLAGKGTSDEDICRAVTLAIRAGIRKIKLYMITNWPGEELGDVMRIVDLGKRLADIRDSFGPSARGVQIIMSWTPLLIEAQTPLQWFAVTPPDYMLQAALEELRAHRIWIKIGSKANPAKLAFFQACQRASRDVGEAVADMLEHYGAASWGGFPKDMREQLDAALMRHGFRNGLEDIFGERFEDDLLGWEHIDTGVSKALMWRAYSDMVGLLEGTDADSYDELSGPSPGGNEWVARCDQRCSGQVCGVCSREDLELRRLYVRARAGERDLTARPVVPVDHSTVALRVRLRVERPVKFRYVPNESLVFIIRRALYRAVEETGFPAIAARTVRLASSGTGYRDRSAGTDYAEFGITRTPGASQLSEFLPAMDSHLRPWLMWDGEFPLVLPATAKLPAHPRGLWELEVGASLDTLQAALRSWHAAAEVPVLLRSDSFYAGAAAEPGNAKEHVSDFWVVRDGPRIVLRMMLTGRLGPYQAYAALTGKASWLDAARYVARRVDFFSSDATACDGCGMPVPVNLVDVPWSAGSCPRCGDRDEGKIIAELPVPA
jgi:radical SAM superfamily enzyme YgiQ (UPF0313 family)